MNSPRFISEIPLEDINKPIGIGPYSYIVDTWTGERIIAILERDPKIDIEKIISEKLNETIIGS